MSARRSGAATGSGLNSSASTMVKSAVLKPMPIASDATATSVNAGLFRSHRRANRMSPNRDSSKTGDYNPRMKQLLLVILAATAVVGARAPAPGGAFTLDDVLNYPF